MEVSLAVCAFSPHVIIPFAWQDIVYRVIRGNSMFRKQTLVVSHCFGLSSGVHNHLYGCQLLSTYVIMMSTAVI